MKLYQILGYAGALPFIACLAAIIHPATSAYGYNIAFIQIAYGGFIASFLAGSHWLGAIKNHQGARMLLAMLPSIVFLGLLVLALFTSLVGEALIAGGLIFPLMLVMDMKYIKNQEAPHNYMRFRAIITAIVTLTLITAGLTLIT